MLIAIAHARWALDRQLPLQRLTEQHPDALIVASSEREHASVWAPRLWRAGLGDPFPVFLNDDVTTAPAQALSACLAALPDECDAVSLATVCTDVRPGERWIRCYLATGPGYAIRGSALPSLIDFYDTLPENMRKRMNEDEVMTHWAWSRQKPFWQCVPSLVRHHTEVKSTLGFDNHPMRVASHLWDEQAEHDVCAPWPDARKPRYVPHPWMGEGRMRIVRSALMGGSVDVCIFCGQRACLVVSPHTGQGLCGQCLTDAVGHVLTNARVG